MKKIINQLRIEGKVRLFILLILFVLLQICIHEVAKIERNTSGLSLFYRVQNCSSVVWLYLVLTLILPNLFAINSMNQKNNKFSSLITTRIGHRTYFINHIIFNGIFTLISMLVIQLIILITIHFFYSPIVFNPSYLQYDTKIFGENDVVNILVFISLTCTGYTVFSTFLYSLQSYIKNSYLFRSIGLLLGIVLYVAPIVVNAGIKSIFPSAIIDYFFSGLCLSSLLNPGLYTMSDAMNKPYIVFLIGCVIYMSMSFFFLRIMYKKERYCD